MTEVFGDAAERAREIRTKLLPEEQAQWLGRLAERRTRARPNEAARRVANRAVLEAEVEAALARVDANNSYAAAQWIETQQTTYKMHDMYKELDSQEPGWPLFAYTFKEEGSVPMVKTREHYLLARGVLLVHETYHWRFRSEDQEITKESTFVPEHRDLASMVQERFDGLIAGLREVGADPTLASETAF